MPIFGHFIRDAMAGKPAVPFRRPEGINLFPINALNGERGQAGQKDVIIEAFKPGQRPLGKGERGQIIDVPGAKTAIGSKTLQGIY